MKILDFIKNIFTRINYKPNFMTVLEIVYLIVFCPLAFYLPPELFIEDGVVENLQLGVLLMIFIIALRSKYNSNLFKFAAMIVIFLMMRETNLFRSWFCERYLDSGEMCRWNKMKYGFIPENLRLIFAIYAGYFFCKHRLDKVILRFVNQAPIYFWDIALLIISAAGATLAEFSFIDSEAMEESCELLSYIALGNCVWRYKTLDI